MRLKSLYIQEYKNIKEQTFDFSNNTGYIALIGLNSSGKSNLIEAIALIFNSLLNKKKKPFKYEIQYEYDGKIYTRKPQLAYIDGKKVKISEMFYPSSVIACYSGEELRLWRMAFEDYHMHYFKNAIDGKLSTPNFIYLNKYCWSIALIALMSSENNEIKKFLKENLNIDDLNKVEISIEFTEVENFKDHAALKWINRIKEECLDKQGKATLKSFLSYDVTLLPNQTKGKEKGRTIFHYLYLLSQPKKNTEKGNTIDKYITRIRVLNKGISLFSFSEGHKKLILIECITRILGDNSSLLLLDEPDAYVHIALKKEILNSFGGFEGQTVLTTHSPLFVNQMEESNIFPMQEGRLLSQAKRKLISKIANNELNIIDSACVVSSKYLIVTEGPDDIYHIKFAINFFSSQGEKYDNLNNVSFLFMGGAREVDNYNEEILKPLYDTMEAIVFVFDFDEEGREGAKMVQKLIDSGNKKFHYVFYYKTYPVPEKPQTDFYLEDFFERNIYSEVNLPEINGVPSYAELQKGSTWAKSIKKKIQKKKKEKSFLPEDYNNFKEFIDQLVYKFNF